VRGLQTKQEVRWWFLDILQYAMSFCGRERMIRRIG